MDFQTHQDHAKQKTPILVGLFALGVVATAALMALLVWLLTLPVLPDTPVRAMAIAALATLLFIGTASLVKSSMIRSGGGAYIATSMGGRRLDFNTLDAADKQLTNVVEEIAIASGLPVPAVFVLDIESGINAFAAGWTADDAAIGVTRGALQHLSRSELQGVIAHEFAHIRNGDTRIKTRMIGWVFGIVLLTVLAKTLLKAAMPDANASQYRSEQTSPAAVMVMSIVGYGLLAVGSVGTLFARLIQSEMSLQREFLADASAAQFTRDPDGLGQALSKIGGMNTPNKIRSPHAVESAHLFFSSPMSSTFATHPPLKTRVSRLMPRWNGTFATIDTYDPYDPYVAFGPAPGEEETAAPGPQPLPLTVAIPGLTDNGALPLAPSALLLGATLTPAAAATAQAAPTTTDDRLGNARALLARIPEPTQQYLYTRSGAIAAVLGLLVSDDPTQRQNDLALAAKTTRLDATYIDQASSVIGQLARPLQLPAIDIALHSIRETPREFQEVLRLTVLAIEGSRPEEDLFRWMLRRVLIRHLEDQHDTWSSLHNIAFQDLHDDAAMVLSAVAEFNSSGPEWAAGAYAAGLHAAGIADRPLAGTQAMSVEALDQALDQLSHLDLVGRQQFVSAALAVVRHDATVTADEAELVRVIADAVRLPIPPLLPSDPPPALGW